MTEPDGRQEVDGIRIGDTIRAYHSGIHVVTGFKSYGGNRDDGVDLVIYESLLSSKMTRGGAGRTRTCHIDYCKVVTPEILQEEMEEDLRTVRESYERGIKFLRNR